MSERRQSRHPVERLRSLACVLMGFLLVAAASAAAQVLGPCSESDPLALNATFRSLEGASASRDCHRIVIAAPGILTLDASAPTSPEVEPRLEFLGPAPKQDPGRYRLLERRPRGVVVEIETPGTFFLTVVAEDPAQPLAGYKLRNAFVDRGLTAATQGIIFCNRASSEVPGRTGSPAPGLQGVTSLAGRAVDEEECEVIELNSGPYHRDFSLLASCGRGEADDHGDTALCATPLALGAEAAGTIGNVAGDDEDFFTFDLDEQRTLKMEVLETASGHLTLYDRRGVRLDAGTARLVRTLPEGAYYLRVQSPWASQEPYVMALQVLDPR